MRRVDVAAPPRRPSVSVVVPCYNYGRFLSQCVGSVLEQRGVEVDVVIVDDASPDGSVEVARTLAATYERVRVVENAVNQGHIRTYNLGLREAAGDYVVLLSADDMLAPGSLARATYLLEQCPDLAFVYGFPVDFTDRPPSSTSSALSKVRWTTWTGPEWLHRLCRRGSNLLGSPEAVMRAGVMADIGGFRADLPHSADMYLWMEAARRGGVGRVNGPAQAYYRVHGGNMHLVQFGGLLTDITERRKTFDQFYAQRTTSADEARMHGVAMRAVADEAVLLAHRCLHMGERSMVEGLVDCARDADPSRLDTLMGRALRRRLQQPDARSPEHRAIALYDDLSNRVRWRRWRRYGVW